MSEKHIFIVQRCIDTVCLCRVPTNVSYNFVKDWFVHVYFKMFIQRAFFFFRTIDKWWNLTFVWHLINEKSFKFCIKTMHLYLWKSYAIFLWKRCISKYLSFSRMFHLGSSFTPLSFHLWVSIEFQAFVYFHALFVTCRYRCCRLWSINIDWIGVFYLVLFTKKRQLWCLSSSIFGMQHYTLHKPDYNYD